MKKIAFRYLRTVLIVGMILFFCVGIALAEDKIRSFEAKPSLGKVELRWESSILQETESVILLKKEGSCPLSMEDGQELYNGNGNNFTDEVSTDSKYCYGVFIYDVAGNYSNMGISDVVEAYSFTEYVLHIIADDQFISWGLLSIIVLAALNYAKNKGGFFVKRNS